MGSRRLKAISDHLADQNKVNMAAVCREKLQIDLHFMAVNDVEVSPAPPCYEVEYQTLLTPDAVRFIAELVREFDQEVDQLFNRRVLTRTQLAAGGQLPDFLPDSLGIRSSTWKVQQAPPRLIDRRVDIGDISPANTQLLLKALNSKAKGVQIDLDDGHCPSWSNQLKGLFNIYQFTRHQLQGAPHVQNSPLLMFRPRAWNMLENNLMVGGKIIPGCLFDFGLHMFHNAKLLIEQGSGPFFYLPKLEGYLETRLWNNIFVWAQNKLGIAVGTIKASILIENILASFELEEILFEIKDHSAGLNCGMWDYSASFISTFGNRPGFILPDRKKYVSMDKLYLKNYLDLVIQTCHKRGCHATGGMVPLVLPENDLNVKRKMIDNVCRAKAKEIKAGADGFLVFDPDLVEPLLQLWEDQVPFVNQLVITRSNVVLSAVDLLQLPKGGFTLDGLLNNITVGIMFIEAWLRGEGMFILNGAVEDSATAEISRSQVWQAIRHQCPLEGDSQARVITASLVQQFIKEIHNNLRIKSAQNTADVQRLQTASEIFGSLVLKRHFPKFITTFLYEELALRKLM